MGRARFVVATFYIVITFLSGHTASGGREPPPPALTGPDVNLSTHPAPTGRLSGTREQLPVGE
jgi:hypothetical protein